jgi:coenzyme PQQ precursor peptide PqqA
VIVGLRADKLQTGPARVRFFLVQLERGGARPAAFARTAVEHGGPCTGSRPDLLYSAQPGTLRKRQMAWTTPTLVEICIGLEINGYLPAEF